MTPIVVLGSGGHAAVVVEAIEAIGGYEISGLVWPDDRPGREIAGYRVIGDEGSWPDLIGAGIRHAAIGIGGWDGNAERRRLFARATAAGFEIVTIVHPAASISPSASVAAGSTICSGVILNTRVSVGRNVVIAVGATVEHDASIGDHALVSNGAHIGARAVVGEEALVAIGAVVAGRVTIGAGAVVAAGAVAVDDVPAGVQVRGVPARPVKGPGLRP